MANVNPTDKKAFEVAYALFRVAEAAPNRPFAESLERQAIEIIESAIRQETGGNGLKQAIITAEYLLKMGAAMNFVSQLNADIICEESGNLANLIVDSEHNPAIRQFKLPDVAVKDIFKRQSVAARTAIGKNLNGNTAIAVPDEIADSKDRQAATNRQSAIIEKIRQSGNCRMGELIAAFPEVSERTIRYDIQSLVVKGTIERVGTGGVATFYKLGSAVAAMVR